MCTCWPRATLARTLLWPLCVLLAGCAQGSFDSSLDAGVKSLFSARRTPQQYMILAVSSDDPDVRRDSVEKIAKSKKYNEEWAIKGFAAIALLETNEQTRCIAIRALARTGDPRAVDAALKVLNYEDHPREVQPPVAVVRSDAALALAELSERGQVPPERYDEVLATLIETLQLDRDRHARIAAARGLAVYFAESAVKTLIQGLRDEDFAVTYRCETSLIALTGHTHECNPVQWETWMTAHRDDLFAHAGEVPETRRPPYANKWQRAMFETKEFFTWLWPGAKE